MSGKLQVGDVVLGEVIGIKPYGAFLQLPTGEVGMIHISEVAEEYVKDIHDYLAYGQQVAVKIIGLNEEGKYNLSIRQLTKREEEAARYSHQVREFHRVLKSRGQELKLEASWRRAAQEKQRALASSRTSLLNWLKGARKAANEAAQRSGERRRFYDSLDLG
jgi:S1 RNA binding domain protein